MLAVFAEFETNLRRERQAEGIAKAKAEGKCNGRPASIDVNAARIESTRLGTNRYRRPAWSEPRQRAPGAQVLAASRQRQAI
jgi:DNA invertase Pin-like site-specific DNA recombinase